MKQESTAAAPDTRFPGATTAHGSAGSSVQELLPSLSRYGQIREAQNQIWRKPTLNKPRLAPSPSCSASTVGCQPPCTKHFHLIPLLHLHNSRLRAIAVREMPESKCRKGVAAEERGVYSSTYILFAHFTSILNLVNTCSLCT